MILSCTSPIISPATSCFSCLVDDSQVTPGVGDGGLGQGWSQKEKFKKRPKDLKWANTEILWTLETTR